MRDFFATLAQYMQVMRSRGRDFPADFQHQELARVAAIVNLIAHGAYGIARDEERYIHQEMDMGVAADEYELAVREYREAMNEY